MGAPFRYARFAVVWVLVFFVARLALGVAGVPYAQGTNFFSLVTLSYFAALFTGAFSRRLWGLKWHGAMTAGAAIALTAQVLILLATALSYAAGVETYYNHPTALNVEAAIPLGQALGIRAAGLVVNTIAASIIALIGWAMGNLVPAKV